MNHPNKQTSWQERCAKLIFILAWLAVAYFFIDTVIRLVLPFLLAGLLAALIRPMAKFLERKCKFPQKVAAIILLLLFLLITSSLIFVGCERLIWEIQKLSDDVTSNSGEWSGKLSGIIDTITRLSEHIPFLKQMKTDNSLTAFWAQVDAKLAEIISDTLTRWSGRIPEVITAVIRALPGALIFLLTFLIAAFYLCADGQELVEKVSALLPTPMHQRITQWKTQLCHMGSKYLRAYFLLFLLTFLQLLVGLSILHRPYTVLPAFIIALVDILPVLGISTVLVPWGIFELIRGNVALGTGLLVLCAIMLLIRQLIEPRIIGKSLGLHPLTTLFAAYVGLQLFGLFGMLLGPAVAMVIKGWVLPPEDATV